MRKLFDRELFNENDKRARKAVKRILEDYNVIDNPKKMGVDLIVQDKDGNTMFYVECEIKKVWKSEFTYTDVQFPFRKEKYCLLDKPTYFIMLNYDLSQFLVVKHNDMLASPKEIVRNKYVPYGEEFFKVSLEKVKFNEFKE